MLSIKYCNKKASDIKLVYLYSTIKMMHGPVNISFTNIVHLVGKIKEYIDPKGMGGGGGELKKLPGVNVAFTCGLFIKLNKSSKLICLRQQHQAEYRVAVFI